jgi:hypothetical protein
MRIPATLIAALTIALPCWLMMPLSAQIHAERARLKYGGASVNRRLREQIGQGMAIGLLAGFRGVVADFVWIQSHGFWEKKQWLQQYRDILVVTTLQPQSVLFWDIGAWHMAWNIGYAERVDTNNLTEAMGIKRERLWHERAEEFLKRGINNVPNRYELYFKLGWLYLQKFKDPCSATVYYRKAIEFPDAPKYVGSQLAHALENCGDVVGAYNVWKRLHGEPGPFRSVIDREIRRLENVLNIPDNERVFPISRPSPSA